MADRRRAFAVLLLLARPQLTAAEAQRAGTLAVRLDGDDWAAIARAAVAQRTAPWVARNVRILGLSAAADATEQLREGTREAARRAAHTDATLAVLRDLVGAPGAPAMLIKGRAVEARAYPADVLRPQVDVDLAVRPGSRGALIAELEGRGFRRFDRSRSGHQIAMRQPGGPILELHLTLVCPFRFAPFARPRTSERIFARAGLCDGLLVPSDVDHTAVLLVHLVEAGYADLRHVADLAAWLRAVEPDPDAVWAVARRWQATRAVATGLEVVARHSPDALGLGWRAVTADVPRDWQATAAEALRQIAMRSLRRGRLMHPRWVEAAGLMSHLDRPVRWAASWLAPGRCGAIAP